jgi:hypothetical protein
VLAQRRCAAPEERSARSFVSRLNDQLLLTSTGAHANPEPGDLCKGIIMSKTTKKLRILIVAVVAGGMMVLGLTSTAHADDKEPLGLGACIAGVGPDCA